MKKTLVALAVTAFAASASALTIYDKDGSNVQFDGSLRLLLDNSKEDGKRAHSNLKNDGSRFGVRVKHDIAEDFYALGRLEFRFDEKASTDQFGKLYAKRAYVGLGSKQYGEVTFGRQLTIGDDIARAGFDNTYGVTKTPLTTSGTAVARYDYKGIEGLQVGVDYRFAENRDDNGEVVKGKLKSGYGAGAVYEFGVGEGQSASVAAGYTRDNFATGTSGKNRRDAGLVGASYTVNNLTLAVDYGLSVAKNEGKNTRENGVAVGAKYKVTPQSAVYGNYVYLWGKNKDVAGQVTSKTRSNRYMLGAEYQFHKQVKAFVEGSVQKNRNYTATGVKTGSTTDRGVGVGLRVFW